MKLSIIVAVYNEAFTVTTLLQRVWDQSLPGTVKEIIVVESNSTDGSRERVKEFATQHADESSRQVRVIYQSEPRGKGHAIRQGFAIATGEILLIQDADLEYEVSDYPDLLKPIIEGRTAFVLGSRHLGPVRWKIRRFARGELRAAYMNLGGMLFHGFFNLLFGVRLTDPTSMYKVFRAECLEGLRFACDRFDFDFELLGKLIRSGFTPLEVPISYQSRGFDEGKKIRIFLDPLTWVFAIVRSRFVPLGVGELAAPSEAVEPTASTTKIG